MLQKGARMLNATSAEHVYMLVALSALTYVRHVGGAEWARGKLDSAFVRREDSF